MKRYLFLFDVTGNSEFPMDMLRYDQCYPHTSDDASQITASFHDRKGPYKVTLVVASEFKGGSHVPITPARWSSFLWSVDPSSVRPRP